MEFHMDPILAENNLTPSLEMYPSLLDVAKMNDAGAIGVSEVAGECVLATRSVIVLISGLFNQVVVSLSNSGVFGIMTHRLKRIGNAFG